MTTDRPSRNSGAKARTREQARQHGITYQQELERARAETAHTAPAADYAIRVGRSVTINEDDEYSLSATDLTWIPFSQANGSCLVVDRMTDSISAAICHAFAADPRRPVESVVYVGPSEIDHSTEWAPLLAAASSGAFTLDSFVLGNEHLGYGAAEDAATAIAGLRPHKGRTGVVVLTIEHPYPQVTDEANKADFDANYVNTQWESSWRPLDLTDGPYWSESVYEESGRPSSTNHVLTVEEQRNYERYLKAIEQLLDRAGRDNIIVMIGSSQGHHSASVIPDVLGRFGGERFGSRMASVHVEYQHQPRLENHFTANELAELLPQCDTNWPDPLGEFWSGMNPKGGRVVFAHFAGQEAGLAFLCDPPGVESYWSPSYEAIVEHALR
jgi:hypothetical protein